MFTGLPLRLFVASFRLSEFEHQHRPTLRQDAHLSRTGSSNSMGESKDSVTERLIASNTEVLDDAQVEYGPVGERAYAPEDEQDRDLSNDPSEYAPEHGMPW